MVRTSQTRWQRQGREATSRSSIARSRSLSILTLMDDFIFGRLGSRRYIGVRGNGTLRVRSPGPCHVGPNDRSLSVMLSEWKKRQPSCPRTQGLHGLWIPDTTARSLHPLLGFLARRIWRLHPSHGVLRSTKQKHKSRGAPLSTRRCPARSRQAHLHSVRSVGRGRSRASLSAGCASESLIPTRNSTPMCCTAGCTKKRSDSLQDWLRM